MSCVRDLLATSLSTVTFQLPISLRLLITEYWMMWSSFNWTIVFILGIIKQMYPDTSIYTYMHHQTIFCWCFCGWTFIWPLPKWVWRLMHHNRQCNDVFVYKRSSDLPTSLSSYHDEDAIPNPPDNPFDLTPWPSLQIVWNDMSTCTSPSPQVPGDVTCSKYVQWLLIITIMSIVWLLYWPHIIITNGEVVSYTPSNKFTLELIPGWCKHFEYYTFSFKPTKITQKKLIPSRERERSWSGVDILRLCCRCIVHCYTEGGGLGV